MRNVPEFLSPLDLPTLVVAVLLVFAVVLVIQIGRAPLTAAVFGALAGAVSLGEGNPLRMATAHATIGFAGAAVTLFLIRLTKSLMLWLLITAAAVMAILLFGVG